MDTRQITDKFDLLFNKTPILIRSPGRINLIGEHTDYNDGFVFPAAIDKSVYFAVATNNKQKLRFYSYDLDEYFEMEISTLSKSKITWANYLLGVYAQFIKAGYKPGGVDCVFGGDIPSGAGLSSSAAIENGFAFALNKLFHINTNKLEMVKMSQQAEHEYAGVKCGIMDQFASMFGKKNKAIKLDCRSLDFDYVNIDLTDNTLILCDTKVKHKLASSEYNFRRRECEEGVNVLQKHHKNITALRDVSLQMMEQYKSEFDPVVYKRCTYVVKENKRVEEAFRALQKNDMQQLGQLMYESHEGLRDEFEVSCRELDLLFDEARKAEEVIGSRMMGGGFGGCTINLVKNDGVTSFSEKITKAYHQATGIYPEIIMVTIDDGTREINH
jgi:galactokinase